MPTLAEILRQTGYSQDGALTAPASNSPMTKVLSEHIKGLPQKFEANTAEQMALLGQAFPGNTYESMMTQGDPKAMAELAMQAPIMGSTAIFHGTSPKAAMNIAKRGFNVKKSADGSIWFTTNPEIGEVAATGKGAVIKRLIDEDKLKLATREQAEKYFTDQLINEGYQGVKHSGMTGGTHYQIFDPKVLLKEKTSRKQLLEEQLNNLQNIALTKGSPIDVSSTFGKGAEKIQYKDPNSEGFINLLVKPDGTASVLSLEVSEKFRGKGIGQKLQEQAMKDYPELQGQVSSKAAAKTAYRLGRRPVGLPNATLDDVFKTIDENSSVNLITPKMQELFNKQV